MNLTLNLVGIQSNCTVKTNPEFSYSKNIAILGEKMKEYLFYFKLN